MGIWKRVCCRLTVEKWRSMIMMGIFTVFAVVFLYFISFYYVLEMRRGQVGTEVDAYISIRNVDMDESYPGPVGLSEESKRKIDQLDGIVDIWESCAVSVTGDSFAFIGYKGRGIPLEAWESSGCLLYTSDISEHAFFKETGYQVINGHLPEEGGSGAQAAVSESLSLLGRIGLGDRGTVKSLGGKEIPLEIVGITDVMDGIESENCIFMNKEAVFDAMEVPGYREVRYYIEDAEKAGEFIEEIKGLNLPEYNTLQISSNLLAYQQALAMIENVQRFLWGCLVLILILSVIIIGILYLHELLEREKEFGILLALGEKKERILLQFLGEIFIVMAGAAVIGAAIARILLFMTGKAFASRWGIVGNVPLDIRSIAVLFCCNLLIAVLLVAAASAVLFRQKTKRMLEKGE